MNIIDVQDQLKDFSEQQLIKEMQMPSGNAPQFLVLTEIQRRKRMRDDFAKRQAAAEPTVAQEALSASGVPTEGIAGMSEAMAPQSAASDGIGTIMPQTMRQSAPPPAPMPDDMAMGMRSGGLMSYGDELSQRLSNDKIDPFLDEVEQMASDRFGFQASGSPIDDNQDNLFKAKVRPAIGFIGETGTGYSGPVRPAPHPPSFRGKGGARIAVPFAQSIMANRQSPFVGYSDGGIVSLAAGGGMKIEERRMKNGQIGLFRGNTFLGLKEENKSKGSLAEKIGFGEDRDVLGRIKDALGLQEGGVIKAQNGLPLGLRQRNPGNIRPGAGFIGETGTGSGYSTFGSDDEGLRAIQRLLMTYGDKYDIRTLRQLANRYAPPSDNNPTGNYIDFLSEKTGIDPDAEINLAESGSSIIPAIVGFEQGQQPYSQAQIDRAIRAAGTDDPAKVAEILGQPLLDDVLAERGVSPSDLSQADAEPNFMSAMAASNDDESSEKTEPVYESRKNQGLLGKLMNKISPPSDIAELEAIQRRDRFLGSQVKADKESISALPDAIESLDKKIAETPINTEADVKRRNELRKTKEGLIAEVNQKKENLPEKEVARGKTIDLVNEAAERSFNDKKNEEISGLEKALSIATNDKDKAALEKKISDAKEEKFTPKTSDDFDDQETSSSETTTEDKTDDKKEKESNISIDKTSDTSGALSLSDEIKALQAKMDKNRESDKWLALAQAGLALMSSDNPTLLGAAGEAGIEGLKAMREANERYEEGVVDLINARAKLASKTDKGALTASNAITRLGQLQKALSGADGAMMTESEKAEARNEVLILKRFLQERGGLPVYAAMTPEVPAA